VLHLHQHSIARSLQDICELLVILCILHAVYLHSFVLQFL